MLWGLNYYTVGELKCQLMSDVMTKSNEHHEKKNEDNGRDRERERVKIGRERNERIRI